MFQKRRFFKYDQDSIPPTTLAKGADVIKLLDRNGTFNVKKLVKR